MSERFLYVIPIRTTAKQLWDAITNTEAMKQYWLSMQQKAEWKPGAPRQLVFADGRVAEAGEVVEADPPKRLVIKWRNEFRPELKAEGLFALHHGNRTCGLTREAYDHPPNRQSWLQVH
jgi:uncharacterized protein YndB with AHSA1/START domain